jgi:glycosyltransferase involved in cell wall biosynthesis
VHDMTFFLFPELHVPFKRTFFRMFIRLSSFLADAVITDSVSTMKDYVRILGHEKPNISAIHLGHDNRFSCELEAAAIQRVREKYGIKGEYLLFIGTIEPRKNVETIVRAFSRLRKDGFDLTLVIAGKKGWDYDGVFSAVEKLHIEDSVVFTGFLQEAEKPYLLAGTKLFIYPSIYEGFGIPVLEAMACGIPTITSNVSSMPEIAGEAAVLVDPASAEELYSKMKRLLLDEEEYRKRKVMSLKQAENFSWTKTARHTVDVYKAVGRAG